MTLRSAVARQMVRFHDIPPELAEYHVSHMDPAEVRWRFLNYWRRGEVALALGVGCALGLREFAAARTSQAEYGGTILSAPESDSGAFPPQGGGEGWFCF